MNYSKTSLKLLTKEEIDGSIKIMTMNNRVFNILIISLVFSVSNVPAEVIKSDYSLDECIKIAQDNSLKIKKIKEDLNVAQYCYGKTLKDLWGMKINLNLTPKSYKFYDQPIVLQEEVQLSDAEANSYEASNAQRGILSMTKLFSTGGKWTIEGRVDRNILKGELAGSDASYESFQKPEIKLEYNHPFFLFKKNPYKRVMREAVSSLKMANLDFNISSEELVYQVKKTYLSCLLSQEKINICKETVEFTQQLYHLALANFNAGKISKIDLSQIEIRVEEDEEALLSAIDDDKIKSKKLKSIIGLQEEVEIKLIDKLNYDRPQEIDCKEILSSMLNNSSLIKKKEEMIKLAEIDLERIKEKNKPDISLNLDYGYQDKKIEGAIYGQSRSSSKESNQWEVGLNFNYPLFDSGKIKTELKEYEAKIASLRYNLMIEKEKIRLDIEEIDNRMTKIKREIVSLDKRIEYAELALKSANIRYKEGIGTIAEILQAQNLKDNLKFKKKEAVFNLLIILAELEKVKVTGEM